MRNTYFDSLTTGINQQSVGNLFFTDQINLPTNPSGAVEMDLISTIAPAVQAATGANAAFLALKTLILTTGQLQKNRQGNWEAYAAPGTTLTIPPGNGNQQVVIFGMQTGGTRLWSYAFSSQGANITITNIELKRGAEPNTAYRSVIGFGTTITAGGNFTVGSVFNPAYGFENMETNGDIAIRITANNSAAGNQTVFFAPVGEVFAIDDFQYDVDYISPAEVTYNIAGQLPTSLVIIPIDLMIPFPLVDPGSTNYGKLIFTNNPGSQFYDSFLTIDAILEASLIYLLPGAN